MVKRLLDASSLVHRSKHVWGRNAGILREGAEGSRALWYIKRDCWGSHIVFDFVRQVGPLAQLLRPDATYVLIDELWNVWVIDCDLMFQLVAAAREGVIVTIRLGHHQYRCPVLLLSHLNYNNFIFNGFNDPLFFNNKKLSTEIWFIIYLLKRVIIGGADDIRLTRI